MDTTPLRASRDFRLLFLAGTVFYFGAMVSYVAIPYQIYTLTGSNFAVGAIGLGGMPLSIEGRPDREREGRLSARDRDSRKANPGDRAEDAGLAPSVLAATL